MTDYWRDHPTVPSMVAAYFGIKPEKKPDPEAQDFSELIALGNFKEGPLI